MRSWSAFTHFCFFSDKAVLPKQPSKYSTVLWNIFFKNAIWRVTTLRWSPPYIIYLKMSQHFTTLCTKLMPRTIKAIKCFLYFEPVCGNDLYCIILLLGEMLFQPTRPATLWEVSDEGTGEQLHVNTSPSSSQEADLECAHPRPPEPGRKWVEEVVGRDLSSSQRETVCGGIRTGAARHAQIKDRGHAPERPK